MEPAVRATSPEISTPDGDEKSTDDSAGIGRSYECGFCKRGFTNAQALGGHMNIHRKDKAKAKQKTHYDQQIKSSEKCANLMYYDPRLDQKMVYDYTSGGGPAMNYRVYLPSPNPNSQFGNYGLHQVWKPEGLDPSLSLRIGQSEPNVIMKENEVDLELRLGCGIKNDEDDK